MGGGGKDGGGGSSTYDYYGSLAGAICCGPIDSIVAILVDGKAVWPKAPEWKSGTSIALYSVYMVDGVVYQATQAHTSSAGNKPPNSTYWSRYRLDRVGSSNPLAISVEGYGTAYLYWGTTDQTLDTVNEKILNDNGHPPYRRQAVLVLKDFLFGRERNAAPNIEVIVRRFPVQSAISNASTAYYLSDGQANPVGSLLDLYTDKVYGAGLTLDSVGGPDSATAAAVAEALIASANQTWMSPILTQAKTLRQFTSDLLAYFDGWLRFSKAGEIEFGRFLHNTAAPVFTESNTIDFNDLIDEVSYSAEGFASTYNQTQVKFTDRERSFKDGSVTATSGYNIAVTGEPRTAKIDRPWITRRQQASDHAAEWQKIYSEPKISGSLVVRAEKAENIAPGSLFLLTHDALSISMVCRCLGKDIAQPPAGRVTIRFETDRAAAPLPYQPTPVATSSPEYAAAESITLYQFFQPPIAMVPEVSGPPMACLIARKHQLTIGANIFLQQEDKSGFYEIGEIRGFGIYGTLQTSYNPTLTRTTSTRARASNIVTLTTPSAHGLTAGMTVEISGLGGNGFNGRFQIEAVPSTTSFTYYSAGNALTTTTDTGGTIDPINDDVTEDFRVTLDASTVSSDLNRMTVTQTEDAINDRAVYVVMFNAIDTSVFEIFTLRAMRIANGESFYRLKVRRGEYGSTKRSGVTGDFVWIGYRDDLVALFAKQFTGAVVNMKTVTFRIQSFNAVNTAVLSDTTVCPNIFYTFADLYAPAFAFDSVKADGTEVTNFTTNYTTSTVWTIQGKVTDKSGNIVESSLYAVNGGIKIPIWTESSEPIAEVRFGAEFKLPSNGTWQVFAESRDASGRVTKKQLTQGGTSTPSVTIQIRGNNDTAAPTASPIGQVFPQGTVWPKTVTLATTTPGAHIEYQIVNVGAVAGATWTTISATSGQISVARDKRVYARAHVNGSNYSSTVYWDYTQAWNTLRPSGGGNYYEA